MESIILNVLTRNEIIEYYRVIEFIVMNLSSLVAV